MSRVHALVRQKTIAECIAAVWPLMDIEGEPGPVAHAMLAELKRLQDDAPVVPRFDYFTAVQERARADYWAKFTKDQIGREFIGEGMIDTPHGQLRCQTWRVQWTGPKRSRVTWRSEQTIDWEFVSVREIKALGLAQRPTSRNRQSRGEDI